MSKYRCNCLTCDSIRLGATDYRFDDRPSMDSPRPCGLCGFRIEIDTYWMHDMAAYSPLFVPDEVKAFLQCEWLCESCLGLIDAEITKRLRVCWSKASPEVIQLGILRILNRTFGGSITHNSPKAIENRKQSKIEMDEMLAEWKRLDELDEKEWIDIPITPRVRARQQNI